jgi:hypothetical protein
MPRGWEDWMDRWMDGWTGCEVGGKGWTKGKAMGTPPFVQKCAVPHTNRAGDGDALLLTAADGGEAL